MSLTKKTFRHGPKTNSEVLNVLAQRNLQPTTKIPKTQNQIPKPVLQSQKQRRTHLPQQECLLLLQPHQPPVILKRLRIKEEEFYTVNTSLTLANVRLKKELVVNVNLSIRQPHYAGVVQHAKDQNAP